MKGALPQRAHVAQPATQQPAHHGGHTPAATADICLRCRKPITWYPDHQQWMHPQPDGNPPAAEIAAAEREAEFAQLLTSLRMTETAKPGHGAGWCLPETAPAVLGANLQPGGRHPDAALVRI